MNISAASELQHQEQEGGLHLAHSKGHVSAPTLRHHGQLRYPDGRADSAPPKCREAEDRQCSGRTEGQAPGGPQWPTPQKDQGDDLGASDQARECPVVMRKQKQDGGLRLVFSLLKKHYNPLRFFSLQLKNFNERGGSDESKINRMSAEKVVLP